jgi:hypothetical protein
MQKQLLVDNKSSVNQSVTQGLLAYTYGAQGNYQKY